MTTVKKTAGELKRTARETGLAYAGLAVTGMVGFLLIRPQLYVKGDAAATAANLVSHEGLARLGIAVDLAAVVTQALAALWFYKLFRVVEPFSAVAIAAFGLVNAVIMLVGAVFSATALDVALDGTATTIGDRATTTLLMYNLSGIAWRVGALFFGLWLIPMGWCALQSMTMPRALGWILMAGGVGYIVSGFVDFLVANASTLVYVLTVPASIGEFWMVGYLLVKGLRPHTAAPEDAAERPLVATP